jgi:TFIIF-interacting CTD phosphatase-like protein
MSERGELKRIGAKQHKNSGRGIVKADGSNDQFVIDVKEYSKSFSINNSNWSKIVMDTMSVDRKKNPAIMLVLGEGDKKIRLAIIEWNVFEEMRKNNG